MTVALAPPPVLQFFDNQGRPLVGGSLLTQVGGVNTATYQDAAGSVPLPNPIPLNSRGEVSNATGISCQMFLTAGVTYTFTLKDAAGNQIAQATAVATPGVAVTSASLTASSGSSLVGFISGINGAVARTAQSKMRDVVSVMDFGAVGDGVTDDTAAFNLATQSTVAWSQALSYDIFVPSGPGIKYKLNGTVYVRKGQTLRGAGLAAYIDATGNTTTNPFVMGRGFISGVATDDAGGQPVKVENLFILGGPASKGSIYTNAQGFAINSVSLSAVGIGLEFNGAADGLVSGFEIDQSLTSISMTASQNIVFTNFNIYLPNFGFVFNNDCRDIEVTSGTIEYAQYAAVTTSPSISNVKAITFSNVNFTMNVQYGTFLGYLNNNANSVEMQFTGCSFRNWLNWAINHSTGVTAHLTFTGCVFDALKTTAAYAQSTTAKVLNTVPTGGDGTYNFFGCEFRNLLAEIATINDGLTKLNIVGGHVTGCDANATSQKRFNVITVNPVAITVKNVVGFPYVFTSGSNRCANLPWWSASTVWKVSIKGNTQSGGDANYSAAEESVFAVTWQNNAGTKSIFADRINLWQTANRTNPGQLSSVVCLGTAPGGSASTTTFAATGSICVSVPFTAAANFDFYSATAT